MRLLHSAVAYARALFRSPSVDADVAEELRFHIDREAEANRRRGMTDNDAYRAARLTVGSPDDALETARDQRPGSTLRQIGRDVRFGARLLVKAPALAAAGIVVVAIGIGAVTAIFSIVHGVMLRPLPFREPERLVNIWTRSQSRNLTRGFPTAADARDWQRANHVFDDIAIVRTTANLNLTGVGTPERLQGARFSPNLLPLLGASPAIGRGFAIGDDQPGHDQLVLLSDGLWRRRFAADSGIVGRTIQLNGLPHTVIGVMPPQFVYPSRDYVAWVPLVVDPREQTRELTQNYHAVARLRADFTLAQAQQDLDLIAMRLAADNPRTNRDLTVIVEPMLDSAVRDVRPALIALLIASGCLLLIACLNLANLLGARAASRAGEFAVRRALGASGFRLVSQAIAETAPMLAAGGLLGLLAATAGVRGFVALSPPGVPRLENVQMSVPVIVASLTMLVLTGIVASMVPALHAWRADFSSISRERGRGATSGRRHARTRRFGVAAQIAFAVPLLVGAGLLIRSSMRLSRVDLGFDPEGVATFHLAVSRVKYPSDSQVASLYQRQIEAVRAIPGVTHAGMVNRLPLVGNQTMTIHVEQSTGTVTELSAIDSRPVTPDWFAAAGIDLRAGRGFSEHDGPTSTPVVIVDDRLGRSMWPGESPIGKRVQRFDNVWCTVVGVVAHIRATGVDVDPRPQVYWPYRQETQDRMVLMVRTAGPPAAVIAPVTQAIHALDPDQPVYDVRVMRDVVGRSLVQRRLTMMLITAFGVVALALAAIGVYGVVSYGVTQRFREFGIRVALGAGSGSVARHVVREGTLMAVAGTGAGLIVSLALGGAMSALVYEVQPRDVATMGTTVIVLLSVAALASYLPARRAARVDPAIALRSE